MLKLVIPPDTTELASLRAAIRDWAGERDIPEWPLTLIATELVANAMAVTPPGGTIEVSVEATSHGIDVRVADPGPGFDTVVDLETPALPPPNHPGGRGLFIVRQLSSELRARRTGGRTIVSACQRRSPSPSRGGPG